MAQAKASKDSPATSKPAFMDAQPAFLTTNEFALLQRVNPESIRQGLCNRGHYYGICPIKGQNRRLLWPRAEVLALFEDQTASVEVAK